MDTVVKRSASRKRKHGLAHAASNKHLRVEAVTKILFRNEEVGASTDKTEEFRFGSVIVEALAPTSREIKHNILLGQEALRRASNALVKRGVKIQAVRGVPLFHADPKNPNVLVRVLDGKRVRGRFTDGEFRVES